MGLCPIPTRYLRRIWYNMRFILNQYKKAFQFSGRNIMKIFWICTALFLVISVIFHYVFLKFPEAAQMILESFMKVVEEKNIIDSSGNLNVFKLFLNNLQASFIAVVLGFMPFMFLQIFVLISNAAMMGAVSQLTISNNMTLAMLAAGILPHGIFELFAFFYSASLGVYLCISFSKKIIGSEASFKSVIINIARAFILIAVPLLAVAAVIETYLTPIIMELAM